MMMINLKKKDTIELIITGILIIFFIVLVIAFSQRKKGLPKVFQSALPGKLFLGRHFTFDPQRNKGTSFILNKAFGGITEIKRDPFSFGLSGEIKATPALDLSLKGIRWGPDNPSVVINDRVLRVGETIGGFKVVEILRGSVVLENGDSRLELKISQ